MNKKMLRNLLVASCFLGTGLSAADSFAVVNFSTCITESKAGKAEQVNLEDLEKQLGGHLESLDKDLNELAGKLNDPEYMDGLSPEAETEMRDKARLLDDERMRYRNQYYQILNQARMKIVQQLSADVAAASETIAKSTKKQAVFNKEACFYLDPSLDITKQVIVEMDKKFDEKQKK